MIRYHILYHLVVPNGKVIQTFKTEEARQKEINKLPKYKRPLATVYSSIVATNPGD